ncbi:MAG: nucleotide exchange factor GrpE [Puniceicoccales bacterium]|jgi:molecular chaperone GrpE|nr:nucleotide exchange factor GrpE [Puniceicoccales bacterium]
MGKEIGKKQPEEKAISAKESGDLRSATEMEVDCLRARVAELEESLLRARADQDNWRKRMEREREELVERACGSLVEELLPVLDHFQLGLKAAEDADQKVVRGFTMIFDQLWQLLARRGVEALGTVGEAFDPHWAEAIASVPSAEMARDHVLQIIRKGYRLGRRLLRPASVIVSEGDGTNSADEKNGGTDSEEAIR